MVKKMNDIKKLTPEARRKHLENEIALLNKKFGRTVVGFGWEKKQERIPFTNNELNNITGGGLPCGRFSVIWGSQGAAKTSACYDLVSSAQKMDKICLWVDFERSFDPVWAAIMGVDIGNLLIAPEFENAEEAMDAILKLTKEKVVDLIVLDSIHGLSPKGEQETKKGIDKSIEDDTMALLARKLSQFFRMSSAGVAQSNCTMILIGQTRIDLGSFITLERLSGGNALQHWSSLTLHFRRGQKAKAPTKIVKNPETGKSSQEISGFELVVKVNKSKVGPDEGKETRIPFYYDIGFRNKE